MKGRRWTAEEDGRLLARYAAGDSHSEMAARLERHPGSISSRFDALSYLHPDLLEAARAAREAIKDGKGPGRPAGRSVDAASSASIKAPTSDSRHGRAVRKCLGCGDNFVSAHAGNRLCSRCRYAAAEVSPYAVAA